MTIHPCFIGIDIGKDRLDLFEADTRKAGHIANRAEAIEAFAAALDPGRAFVVFEATGTYDRLLRHALHRHGIASARINPARARDFARSSGRLAKTDRIDARMLAEFGACMRPEPDPPLDMQRETLALLHRRRDQLVATRATERGRLADDPDPTGSLARLIAFLDGEIVALDARIAAALRAAAELAAAARLLRSAPGVGSVTATTLVALMPELGHISGKKIAALAGLAPMNHDSGRHRGTRHIRGGRRRVRQGLYMAALAAVRTCARFRTFFDAVKRRSGSGKLAIIATARKLLTVLNAMMASRTAFQT
jgi:transposase